jgi:predicted nucleotidyltransferase
MKYIIENHLDRIEKEYKVKIVLSCESGSRAWGFPSNDSDYDVRFIYINERDWYLTIAEKRNVIELPINKDLDINGWDLRKSLQLLRKSNSPLLEWISSPIRYRVWDRAFKPLAKLSKKAFLPQTSCHHYLSMAKNSISKFQNNEKIKIKTYMYAIRPLLCCEWIIEHLKQPPMHIDDLLSDIKNHKGFKESVKELISIKMDHAENYLVMRSETMEGCLIEKMVSLEKKIPKNPPKLSIDEFDDVFKNILLKNAIQPVQSA